MFFISENLSKIIIDTIATILSLPSLLKNDILLLADVFESFRNTCHEYYKLDPAHYFTSPGLAWDAALKMTGVTLDLVTDVDMYQFIEKGMRGGVSYIANRYSKANNKYLTTTYDPSQHPSI